MEKYNEFLPNGLTVKACRLPNTHSITIILFLKSGCLYEKTAKRGITHLVEHLCFRGWRGQSQFDFYNKIERIGGFLRAATYMNHVVFEITVARQFINQAIDIVRGLFDEYDWSAQDIHSEKEIVLRQIENEYFSFSKRLLAQYFFGNARTLSIMGTQSHIKRFTKKELNIWKQFLFRPENACIILTGNYTDDSFETVLNNFSNIKSRVSWPEVTNLLQDEPLLSKRYTKNIIDCGEEEISRIGLSFDWDVHKISMTEMDFIRNLLATGFVAPFQLRLREELGLLDQIDSGVEYDVKTGILYFIFELNHYHLNLFFDELGKLFDSALKRLDADAFQCTKACFVHPGFSLLDNPQEFAYLLGERTFIGNETFCTVEEYIDFNRQITISRLNDIAREVFAANRLFTMTSTTDLLYDQVDNALQEFHNILSG